MKTGIKSFIIIVLLSLSYCVRSQTIVFDYDDNGNRIYRELSVSQLKSGVRGFPVLKQSLIEANTDDLNLSFKIYPNPAKEIITLEITNWRVENEIQYQIVTLSGNILFNNPNCKNINIIDASSLKNGIYILRVINNGIITDFKIVKSY